MTKKYDTPTSKSAVKTTELEREVHKAIKSFGKKGCISDQVRWKFPKKPYSSVTARYSALEDKKFIVRGPDQRVGKSGRRQLVMRDASFSERFELILVV